MAKKKYYPVRIGKREGIFHSWAECEAAVKGFPGAQFKGFAELSEAENYLAGSPAGSGSGSAALFSAPDGGGRGAIDADRDVIAFVDGSFDVSLGRYAYACIFLTPDGEEQICGVGEDEDGVRIRNVAGEMMGATEAVRWALAHGYTSIQIRYDYQGIECWATGAWQAKNPLTQEYARTMREYAGQIKISFKKVAAHCGDEFNEKADQLAKAALHGEAGS